MYSKRIYGNFLNNLQHVNFSVKWQLKSMYSISKSANVKIRFQVPHSAAINVKPVGVRKEWLEIIGRTLALRIDFCLNMEFFQWLSRTNKFWWPQLMCPRAKYYCFFDDDYYVSNRNLFKFLSNSSASFKTQRDEVLFAGRVQFSSPPVRSWRWAVSLEGKWAVSLEDYPYNRSGSGQ